ncbi:GNAT family N-acetyltransferase [Ruegeria sp. WL0004]|uniref:GNAT family N-acetyltransferase n=1 Tax=Ruegeria marisflavi TaxID=2984152 RepID=A0ABT2WQB2_9RHOB|nr:GNAT family N-acetyltransferase [Ruegeria sp. WL0004]MCU9838082.1 GNAT family N-acetyltransferase [Ruegeria sp. WL0004]
MIRSIPILNTARLRLAGMRPEDFDRYARMWADPDVVQFIGGRPKTRGEAWDAFLRNAGHWQMTGFGQWGVILQKTRELIGQAGFFYTSRDLGEDFDPYPEAGWILSPEMQGQGLGREAVQAAHDWFDRIIPGRLVAMVSPENERSLRLAGALGYREMRRSEFGGDPVVLLRRDGPPAHN